MYTSFFIAKNNIKKKKSDVVVIILLIALATMLLYVSTSALSNSGKIVEDAVDACNSSDHTYFTSEEGSKIVADVWKEMDYVVDYEFSPVLYIPNVKYRGESQNEKKEFMFMIGSFEEERAINKINAENCEELKENSVILPYCISLNEGYEVGETFIMEINGNDYEFKIAGFTEDAQFANTLNISIYRAFISEKYIDQITSDEAYSKTVSYVECKVLLEDGTDVDMYVNDFVEKLAGRDKDNVIGFTGEAIKGGVTMMSGIFMGIMLVFSVILILIAIIIMRFSLKNFIEDNLKNIGILQAGGYTSSQLRKVSVMEMGIIGATGVIIGEILSVCGQGIIGTILASMMGLRYNVSFDIMYGIVTAAIIMIVILLITYYNSRVYKCINVLDALRGGIHTHNFKKNSLPLDKTKLPINTAVGMKQIFGAKFKNMGILLIVAILSFASCIGFAMYENFAVNRDFMLKLVGAELGTAIVAGENPDEMGTIIETWKEVKKVGYYKSIDVMASSGDKNKTITCDAWKNLEDVENITIVKGSAPKCENEVMITTVIRDYFGVNIGDVIYLQAENGKKEFIVSGVCQMINNMGQKLVLSYDGFKYLTSADEVKSLQIYIYANDGYDFDDINKLIEEANFAGAEAVNSAKSIGDAVGTIELAMELLCVLFVTITVVVVFLVVFLIIRTKIVSDKKNNGIYKAIGYTTKNLMVQTTMSNLPVIFVGSVVGTLLSIVGSAPLCIACLSFCGIEKCDITIPPVYLVGTVVGITFIAWTVAMTVASRIRKVEPVKMLTEE